MLEQIKELLGIADTSKDGLINYHINTVSKRIINYCNIIEVPVELEYVVIEIVVKRMTKETGVKSVTRGDVKVEYESNADELELYLKDLKTFKRVKFV